MALMLRALVAPEPVNHAMARPAHLRVRVTLRVDQRPVKTAVAVALQSAPHSLRQSRKPHASAVVLTVTSAEDATNVQPAMTAVQAAVRVTSVVAAAVSAAIHALVSLATVDAQSVVVLTARSAVAVTNAQPATTVAQAAVSKTVASVLKRTVAKTGPLVPSAR